MIVSDKFSSKNKKMIIKGAGKFMAKIPGCDELITLGHMNNMRLDIQLDMLDIEGGDSPTPIDTLLRKKTIDITAEDAKFDLNMIRLVIGSKLREGVRGIPYEVKDVELTVVDDAGTLKVTLPTSIATGVGVPGVQVYNKTKGAFVSLADIVAVGTTVTIAKGAEEDDEVVVYYPEVSSAIDPDGFVWVLEERHDIVTNKITLKNPLFGGTLGTATSKTEHVSVRLMRENKLLKKVSSPTPAKDEYSIDPATGEITFNAFLDGEQVYVNYKRPEVVDLMSIGSNDFPLTVSVVHDGSFEQKDGAIEGVQIELYSCRVKSNFTLNAARQTASTHSVTLTVIDPERSDSRLGTIKRYRLSGEEVDPC